MPKNHQSRTARGNVKAGSSRNNRAKRSMQNSGSEVTRLKQPKSPFPRQHQSKPGIESKLTPRPNYEAPHLYGYFYMTKAALPHLQKGSAIVNCGSITGLEGSKELLDYAATKAAIHAFTKSLAQNLVEKGIRVNCVAPGPVWTPLNPSDKEAEEIPQFGADTPMKRPAQPEEIAPAFVFLASEIDSSYVTGEVLTLLGGETTA